MIPPKRYVLRKEHRNCVWCDRRFLPHGLKRDQTVTFGPVERSEDHIIPLCIGGNVITEDLCKHCNEAFGHQVDHHLLHDSRVLEAAERAGISNRELLKTFKGIQRAADGRKFQVTCRHGEHRIKPRLEKLEALGIGAVDGRVVERDLDDLKYRLQQKVRRHLNQPTLATEHTQRIDALISALRRDPDVVHYDPILDEGFRAIVLEPWITVSMRTDPWVTDWCIAKILFATTVCLMPEPFLRFLTSVQNHLRSFVRDGLRSKPCGSGETILLSGQDSMIGRAHSVQIRATGKGYDGEVRLFGSAWWRFSCTFQSDRLPLDKGFAIEIANPLGRGAEVSCRVHRLH